MCVLYNLKTQGIILCKCSWSKWDDMKKSKYLIIKLKYIKTWNII